MQEHGKESFWDKKAETFPRYEPGDETYEAKMLARIREGGVDFRDRTVLDVGSGSGMYTLRLAREARCVTAVDISGEMLRLLRQDAEGMGIDNIEYVHSTWDEFQRDETFDVVFCSMTPAIESEESRRKLLGFAHGWTVFMGFAGVMESDVLGPILEKHGASPRIFNNGPEMRQWLEKQGIAVQSIIVEDQWVEERSFDELVKATTSSLIPYSVTPDQAFLEDYLRQFRTGEDVYVEHTDYKIELLLWGSPEGR
jgi:SAM-dependent methyltransferase